MNRRLAIALAVTLALTGACGDDSPEVAEEPEGTTTTSSGAATPADTSGAANEADQATIVVKDFAFEPNPLTAKVGQTIDVSNEDDVPHTVTADDGSFDSGNIEGGSPGSVTVSEPGEVAYHCEVHENMKGVIQVEA